MIQVKQVIVEDGVVTLWRAESDLGETCFRDGERPHGGHGRGLLPSGEGVIDEHPGDDEACHHEQGPDNLIMMMIMIMMKVVNVGRHQTISY